MSTQCETCGHSRESHDAPFDMCSVMDCDCIGFDLVQPEFEPRPRESVVPGEWTCDKCGFGLSTRTLHALDGGVSVRAVIETELCPNDGTPLRSLTWQELAESQREGIAGLLSRIDTLETALRDAQGVQASLALDAARYRALRSCPAAYEVTASLGGLVGTHRFHDGEDLDHHADEVRAALQGGET